MIKAFVFLFALQTVIGCATFSNQPKPDPNKATDAVERKISGVIDFKKSKKEYGAYYVGRLYTRGDISDQVWKEAHNADIESARKGGLFVPGMPNKGSFYRGLIEDCIQDFRYYSGAKPYDRFTLTLYWQPDDGTDALVNDSMRRVVMMGQFLRGKRHDTQVYRSQGWGG
jgi:hypothetical protein